MFLLIPSPFHLSSHQHLIYPSSSSSCVSIICFSVSIHLWISLSLISLEASVDQVALLIVLSDLLTLTESPINGSSYGSSLTSISLLSPCLSRSLAPLLFLLYLLFFSCWDQMHVFFLISLCIFMFFGWVSMHGMCVCLCVRLCPIKRNASLPAGSLKMKLAVDLKAFHESTVLSVQ